MKTRKELVEKIKVAASYQKFLKNQRKTVKLVGKKEMEPWEAAMKHLHNRGDLRVMYCAYAVLRGRDVSSIDSLNFEEDWAKEVFLEKVNKLVKEYAPEVVEEIAE
jgi:hypothetical protein